MIVLVVCHVELGYATDSAVFFETGLSCGGSPVSHVEGVADGVRNALCIVENFGPMSFMMTPESLQAARGIDFRDHEIGVHVHPRDRLLMRSGFGEHKYLRDYGFAEQEAVISEAKQIIDDTMGVDARTFVAGTWSVNNETVRALVGLRFSHDCSPCPGLVFRSCNWAGLPRICSPYMPSGANYQLVGDLPLVMVPVSMEITGGIVSPESNIGLGFLKAAFREYHDLGMPVFHIAFHSPAMTSRRYQKNFSALLRYISEYDARFCRVSEIEPAGRHVPRYPAQLWPYLTNLDLDALSYILNRAPHRVLRELRMKVQHSLLFGNSHDIS
jgi:hypothetical protein